MHHAGFIACMLHDFDVKVHVTDKCGRIVVSRQMSQKAFVQEWIAKTGEEQLNATFALHANPLGHRVPTTKSRGGRTFAEVSILQIWG